MQLKCTPRQNRKIRILRAAARAHPHQPAGRHAACAGPRVCRARHDLEIWHPCRPVTSSGARKSRFSRKIATLRPPQAAILATPPPVTWSAHAPESIDHGTTSAQPKPVHNQGALSCTKSHFSAGWAQSTDQGKFWQVREIGPAVSAVSGPTGSWRRDRPTIGALGSGRYAFSGVNFADKKSSVL